MNWSPFAENLSPRFRRVLKYSRTNKAVMPPKEIGIVVADAKDLISYVDTNSLEWQQTKPNVRQKVLFQDTSTGQKTLLVQLAPGYQAEPAPPHEWGEYLYILEGTFVDHNQASPAGTYVHNRPGSVHQPTSPDGCTFLLFVPGSRAGEK